MPTQTQSRRAVALALNDLLQVYASGGSGTTATIPLLTDGTAGISANRFDDRWVYAASGNMVGQVRSVQKGGYAAGTGVLTITPGWSAPDPNSQIDITSLFPAAPSLFRTQTDYRSLLNAALRRLNVVREIAVPITTARRISLTTWAAWITPERVLGIREPSPTGATLTDAGWRKPRVIDTGASAVLELRTPFAAATGNLTLEVISPAYTFVNGAESTAGFVAETDTVLPPLDEIMRATLVEAYENLMSRAPTRPAGDYRALWEKQLTDCRQTIRYYDFDRPQQPTSEAAA